MTTRSTRRSRIARRAGWLFVVAALLAGCRQIQKPATPTNAKGTGDPSECKLLGDRIDALKKMADATDPRSDNPSAMAAALHQMAASTDAAAHDIDQLRLTDPDVRATAHDFAALTRDHARLFRDLGTNVAQVDAVGTRAQAANKAFAASFDSFGRTCKAIASEDCGKLVSVLRKIPNAKDLDYVAKATVVVNEARAVHLSDPRAKGSAAVVVKTLQDFVRAIDEAPRRCRAERSSRTGWIAGIRRCESGSTRSVVARSLERTTRANSDAGAAIGYSSAMRVLWVAVIASTTIGCGGKVLNGDGSPNDGGGDWSCTTYGAAPARSLPQCLWADTAAGVRCASNECFTCTDESVPIGYALRGRPDRTAYGRRRAPTRVSHDGSASR